MMTRAAQTREVISFGPFSLVVGERLLTKKGVPVELGARTLDTLLALTSRSNEVVSKGDLLALVWPDVTVEEGSLRFHIASLRKALGDGRDGARYIATLPGRGYCFVAPVAHVSGSDDGRARPAAGLPPGNLPGRLNRMVGRADDIAVIVRQLRAARFVTIVGAGGIGKTTVAVAVGHELVEAFAGAAVFFDLGALSDPDLVASSLASMLGLTVPSQDAAPSLTAYLRDKRVLLILDTCEHLIEAVAALASRLFAAAPELHILATSREALRVEGEQVHKLASFAVPPAEPGLTAAAARTYPAIQLFLERAAARGARLDLCDADAAIVAGICRRLDGVALAIELAAGRVEAYGLEQTAALLDRHLALPWPGQRTAPPRQRTVQATLEWSYGLLSTPDCLVLRRLAVFVGYFTLEAALEVVTSPTIDQARVLDAVDSLVAKSMVAARPIGAMMRYRLLDTTRAYLLEVGTDPTELAELAIRHATYYRRWLERTGTEWPTLSNAAERAPHLAGLGNVRAALEWCFGAEGDIGTGVGLAAAAAPVFLAMSLLTECQRWSERALLALEDAAHGGPAEMRLQAALGMSLMFTRGQSETARAALNRSLAIAEERRDAANQLQLLGPLHMFHLRAGDYKAALRHAERGAAVAETMDDPGAAALSHSLLGIVLHLAGDLAGASRELEAALRHGPGARRSRSLYLGFDHHNWAGIALARTLWLQGHPAQAAQRARQSVEDAALMDHPVTLSIALNWAVSVFFWAGDLENAEEHIDRFIAHAERHALGPYLAAGQGFRGELAIRRGDAACGIESVRRALAELHAARYELLTTAFNIALVQGLAATGQTAEGVALVDENIRRVEVRGDLAYLPELLRLRAALLATSPASAEEAALWLERSLDLGRRQGALAWELRASVDLGTLWAAQGRPERARALLDPVLARFPAGSRTADLEAAERLLATLGGSDPASTGRGVGAARPARSTR